jgi:hypothetical protein
MDALEAAFQRKVRVAREALQGNFARLSSDEQIAFLDAREPQDLAEDYGAARATCPSCGHLGLITGDPEPGWEADWDTDGGEANVAGAFVSGVRLFGKLFHCAVCSLTLDTQYLPLAGFAAVDLTEDDADLEEATQYFTQRLADEYWDT